MYPSCSTRNFQLTAARFCASVGRRADIDVGRTTTTEQTIPHAAGFGRQRIHTPSRFALMMPALVALARALGDPVIASPPAWAADYADWLSGTQFQLDSFGAFGRFAPYYPQSLVANMSKLILAPHSIGSKRYESSNTHSRLENLYNRWSDPYSAWLSDEVSGLLSDVRGQVVVQNVHSQTNLRADQVDQLVAEY